MGKSRNSNYNVHVILANLPGFNNPLPSPFMFDSADRRYMSRALALAHRGIGKASPNPTVGCVIVKGSKTLGEGYHIYAHFDHAEVVAIRGAGERSRGATAYVTLEPCSHHGRTPPCAEELVRAGLRRVVIAMIDPNPLVCGKGVSLLRRAGIKVDLGLLEEEALRLNEPFGCFIGTGRPLVVSKVGMSLDGRIATATRDSHWITSPEGRKFGQSLRGQLDAILVGVGTILADDPELTHRESWKRARPLMRIILDSRLRTPPAARALRNSPELPTLIFCQPQASQSRRERLETQGAEVIAVRRDETGLRLQEVLSVLAKREVLGVLVEGGSEVHWSFLSRKLVDKFYFILAPLVLGGKRSVPCIGGSGFSRIAAAPRFRIAQEFRAGPDLILVAYPSYSRSLASPWLFPGTLPSDERDCSRSSGRK